MSDLSIVINTCAGSTNPAVLSKRGSFGNASKKPYAERREKLWDMLGIYRQHPRFEVIVTGEWFPPDADGAYIYAPSPGRQNDPTDPVWQRHDGAGIASGRLIVFLNDDHHIVPEDLDYLLNAQPADVYSFGRAAMNPAGAYRTLETGWPSYVMGHACAMTREALARVPWNTVPAHVNWDVKHTELCRQAGLRLLQLPDVIAWDIEEGEIPR